MTDIVPHWNRAERKLPPAVRHVRKGLESFLNKQNDLLSKILTARADKISCEKSDARHLEALIVGKMREKLLGKREAADWLRLLYQLIVAFNANGYSLETTRLANVPPPSPSPFVGANMTEAARAEHWRGALLRWIGQHAGKSSLETEDAIAATILSGVLLGGLFDSAKIRLWRKSFHEPMMMANGRAYREFDLPYAELRTGHLQRWFPDVITEMLHARVDSRSRLPSEAELLRAICSIVKSNGPVVEKGPASVTALARAAECWWRIRAAPIDVHAMRRSFQTHSIKSQTWLRLQGEKSTKSARTTKVTRRQDIPRDAGIDPTQDLHSWISDIDERIATLDIRAARQFVPNFRERPDKNRVEEPYLNWLAWMLAGNSASGDQLALSTIRRHFRLATLSLLGIFGDDDPRSMSMEELAETYQLLLSEPEGAGPNVDLAKGLREFHHHLAKTQDIAPLSSIRETLGDEAGLLPVDANLITTDDYERALQWFDQRREMATGEPDIDAICRMVLMLAFRTGMRRMEMFGLRLEDIPLPCFDCLVRPHSERRLKTASSRRRLPLRALLRWHERAELVAWIKRRLREESASPFSNYLFALPQRNQQQVPIETVSNLIHLALRAATGDPSLHLHHMRHSFGTLTCLKLRAAEYPEIISFFNRHPRTVMELQHSHRFRLKLLGNGASPSRSDAYAVCTLLGHSSPAVSMGHYIHCSDLIHYALVKREIRHLPALHLVEASGLSPKTAYARLSKGQDNLLHRVRHICGNRDPDKIQEEPPVSKRPRGRPRNQAPHTSPSDTWITLSRVRATLRKLGEFGMPAEEVAADTRLSLQQVEIIAKNARRFGKFIGLESKDGRPPYPNEARESGEISWGVTLEEKLCSLVNDNALLLCEGTALYLERYNRQRKDVVFKGMHEIDEARTFLKFIKALGISPAQIRYVIRGKPEKSTYWEKWKQALQIPEGSSIKYISPPTTARTTYQKYLGIQLLTLEGDCWPAATASVMLIARAMIG